MTDWNQVNDVQHIVNHIEKAAAKAAAQAKYLKEHYFFDSPKAEPLTAWADAKTEKDASRKQLIIDIHANAKVANDFTFIHLEDLRAAATRLKVLLSDK